jgi:hypothetical protein
VHLLIRPLPRHCAEVAQRGFDGFGDFFGEEVGGGEVGEVVEAFVFEPEEIEAGFVAGG